MYRPYLCLLVLLTASGLRTLLTRRFGQAGEDEVTGLSDVEHEESGPFEIVNEELEYAEADVPCEDVAVRMRYPWCDNRTDDIISLQVIPEGQGLCLDKQCYGAETLRQWLRRHGKLPHNRSPFTMAELAGLMNETHLESTMEPYLDLDAFVNAGRLTPNGDAILIASFETVFRWDVETGARLQAYWGHTQDVLSLDVSLDGRFMLTGSADMTMRLWNINSGGELRRYQGHSDTVTSVAFSKRHLSGSLVASGSKDTTVRVWDRVTGDPYRVYEGHTGEVTSVAFTPDGNCLCSASVDTTVVLWVLRDNSVSPGNKILYHVEAISTISFNLDGDKLLVVHGGVLSVWDLDFRASVIIDAYADVNVTSAAISPDGTQVLAGSADRVARLWHVPTGTELQVFDRFAWEVQATGFSADGRWAFAASDHNARVFDIDELI